MATENSLSTVSQIFDLLRQEKSALIGGDVETLRKVTARKQAWIEEFPNSTLTLDFEEIQKIRTISEQNAALSQACQSAQKTVLQRLKDIQKIQKTMGIYGVDGTFSESAIPPPKVETRS